MMAKIPEFNSIEEEAQFWDTVDITELLDEFEEVDLELDESVKSPRDLSPRCPVCDEILLSRYVEKDVVGGLVTIHRLRELYCPEGHYEDLAEESQKLIGAIEEAVEPFLKPRKKKTVREKVAA